MRSRWRHSAGIWLRAARSSNARGGQNGSQVRWVDFRYWRYLLVPMSKTERPPSTQPRQSASC